MRKLIFTLLLLTGCDTCSQKFLTGCKETCGSNNVLVALPDYSVCVCNPEKK